MEITKALYLSDKEHSMLDMHSMLNIINVIIGELTLLQVDMPGEPSIEDAIREARQIKQTLSDKDRSQFTAKIMGEFQQTLRDMLEEIKDKYVQEKSQREYEQFSKNIDNILSIMDVRVDELLARWKFPDQWLTFTKQQLRKEITDFLDAMAENARHSYSFVYDRDHHTSDNYYVDIEILGNNGEIDIPLALKDVIRDLVANARKYTHVGGTIKVGVSEYDDKLRIIVEDTGRGIANDEIEDIFEFGKRGSNTKDKRTMGGGFGLTKALEVTRHFHGRMWIDSKSGKGTRITIEVPVY